MAVYVDISALVKLVVEEPESGALRSWLSSASDVVSCDLARTELIRAVRRVAPGRVVRAREVLDSILLMTVPTDVFEAAALIEPTVVRPLDAVHLAAALALGDDLESLVTYDERMRDAARAVGLAVHAPA
jgi:uncharacterized protein